MSAPASAPVPPFVLPSHVSPALDPSPVLILLLIIILLKQRHPWWAVFLFDLHQAGKHKGIKLHCLTTEFGYNLNILQFWRICETFYKLYFCLSGNLFMHMKLTTHRKHFNSVKVSFFNTFFLFLTKNKKTTYARRVKSSKVIYLSPYNFGHTYGLPK